VFVSVQVGLLVYHYGFKQSGHYRFSDDIIT